MYPSGSGLLLPEMLDEDYELPPYKGVYSFMSKD